jgi:flagellar biogenesis protein FliO
MIDFHTVWAKFDITNAAVYGTLIAVVVLYVILACILRRFDNSESHQVGRLKKLGKNGR